MDIRDIALKNEEKAIFALRELYGQYGYTQYKMGKFEEYDLYVQNKDFLVSDSVITFTDTDGKLLALKPDVTLSIVKNSKNLKEGVQKVFYDENVYRVSKGTHSFREIRQVGLECIGKVDCYCLYEVLMLAAGSLRAISEKCILDISHLGIVADVLDALGVSSKARRELLSFLGEKSVHEMKRVCREENASTEAAECLYTLAELYGKADYVLEKLSAINGTLISPKHLNELKLLCQMLISNGYGDMINVDFSVTGDMNYYNGIVFRGFVDSIPSGILSGGQYDGLMEKMKKRSSAIGFAVYLDMLENLKDNQKRYDVDTLLVYDDTVDFQTINGTVNSLRAQGKSVYASSSIPEKLSYRNLMKLQQKGGMSLGSND